MEPILRPKLQKIPGGGMPLAKKENHIKDLAKLTRGELLEVKERQEQLLCNKAKLARLPDKGKRIQDFYDKVQAEVQRREGVNEAAAMFSVLNIASKGHEALNKLEWNGHLSENDLAAVADDAADVLDSDDESEMDPLRIIAQRQMHERRVKLIPDEPQLITAEDLAEISTFVAETSLDSADTSSDAPSVVSANSTETMEDAKMIVASDDGTRGQDKLKSCLKAVAKNLNDSFENENSPTTTVEPHVRYVIEKTELLQLASQQRERFKPYKTTVSNVHDPAKERVRTKGKHWENTAATPPLIEHSGAQMLTLLDSVDIQINYLSKLKDLQEQQAAERLAAKLERLELRKIKLPNAEELKTRTAFTAYRTTAAAAEPFPPQAFLLEGDPRYNATDEVHDPLDEEKPSGITYTVFD